MKKNFLALTLLAVSSTFALVSCGGGSGDNSSSSIATVAGRIVLDTKVPAELEVNKTLNLEDYVTVTKVDTWSLETENENISIDGHTVKGIDYGDFTVMIIAGTTKKAYKGTVVSKEKMTFNEKVTALKNDYTVIAMATGSNTSTTYDTSMGITYHNKNYFAAQEMNKSYQPTNTWSGYVLGPNDVTYSMSFNANANDGSNPTNFVVDPGMQREFENYYLGNDLSFKATDFTEILDTDGSPTGVYQLNNRSTDEYGGTLVSDFGQFSAGLSLDSFITQYQATFWAELGENDDGSLTGDIVFHLVGTSNGKTGLLGLALDIFNVGETKISPIESWLANPVYPEPYDVSSITNVFDQMNTSKNYTVESSGYWLNATTGNKASVEDASKATQSANGMFFTYDVTTYVTENDYYSRIEAVSDAEAYGAGSFTAGQVNAAVVRNNTFYLVDGTYANETTTWGTPTASSEIVAKDGETISIWDSTFSSANFTAENLAKANWNSKLENTSGKVFYFNEMGEDNGSLIAYSMMQIGNYIGATIFSNFTQKYARYQYNYWALNTDGTLTYAAFIPWGTVGENVYYYFMESTFKNVGTTSLPAGANLSGIQIPTANA